MLIVRHTGLAKEIIRLDSNLTTSAESDAVVIQIISKQCPIRTT